MQVRFIMLLEPEEAAIYDKNTLELRRNHGREPCRSWVRIVLCELGLSKQWEISERERERSESVGSFHKRRVVKGGQIEIGALFT
jgi:hypothetical protein